MRILVSRRPRIGRVDTDLAGGVAWGRCRCADYRRGKWADCWRAQSRTIDVIGESGGVYPLSVIVVQARRFGFTRSHKPHRFRSPGRMHSPIGFSATSTMSNSPTHLSDKMRPSLSMPRET